MTLFRTTIEIWTEFHPNKAGWEIDTLAKEAQTGTRAYCSGEVTEAIDIPAIHDDDVEGVLGFFGLEDERAGF